jgi:predicted Fe-Mo cluster-binding NifX family protein
MQQQPQRIAIPEHLGRVSPLLDTARRLVFFDVTGGAAVRCGGSDELDGTAESCLAAVREAGAAAVVCGAISGYAHNLLLSNGIEVLPWMCGDVDAVASAHARDELAGTAWAAPGRRRRLRRGRGGCGRRRGRRW